MPGAAAKKASSSRAPAGAAKKKALAQKGGAKKGAAKKAPPKKAPPKKAAVKKAPLKKAAVKKAPPKKAPPKKAPPKKAAVKKAPPKKAPPKKAAVKKAPAKKAAVKKAPTPAKATKARKKTVICELSGFEVTPSAPNLSPKTLERLRQKLLDEKHRLLHQADELAAEADQLAREREAGDTQFDEESGEGDTVNIERERDLLLSASARQIVDDIDDAIVRIKRGTYGVCRYAGRRLSLERLEAIPWADVCVDCKQRADRRR
jgi:RNA polymerase-binding transcription factor DksA